MGAIYENNITGETATAEAGDGAPIFGKVARYFGAQGNPGEKSEAKEAEPLDLEREKLSAQISFMKGLGL